MLASRQGQLLGRSAAQPLRPQVALRPARIAQPVARSPLVCRAAAEVVEADVAGAKGGVAHLRFKRGSVFKVRRVLDVMRGRSFEDAILMMEYMPYRACEEILKALKSAAANAKNNEGAQKSKLVVAEAFADQGPILKRFRCRAQGRGFKIAKPTFHLTIRLEERE
ncbi:ERY2 [Scenedesmus sp. PABB004]|nr:ERY2 [Scenedesmus sp. PABB004]